VEDVGADAFCNQLNHYQLKLVGWTSDLRSAEREGV
jgi:hypothetical protein